MSGVQVCQSLRLLLYARKCVGIFSGLRQCARRAQTCSECPTVQGQRPQRRGRGISLLSVAVYAALLLHRTVEQIKPELHQAQDRFRKGRGTTDAAM
eukprot:364386-Chlamydomonas_euryale.AAC.3